MQILCGSAIRSYRGPNRSALSTENRVVSIFNQIREPLLEVPELSQKTSPHYSPPELPCTELCVRMLHEGE